MNWTADFSDRALKFLARNHISEEEILEHPRLVIRKFRGETVSVDVRKTKGKWAGFYRIRSGKLRIIAAFYFASHRVFIDTVDWRGSAYK